MCRQTFQFGELLKQIDNEKHNTQILKWKVVTLKLLPIKTYWKFHIAVSSFFSLFLFYFRNCVFGLLFFFAFLKIQKKCKKNIVWIHWNGSKWFPLKTYVSNLLTVLISNLCSSSHIIHKFMFRRSDCWAILKSVKKSLKVDEKSYSLVF